jgi:hypothetical protein
MNATTTKIGLVATLGVPFTVSIAGINEVLTTISLLLGIAIGAVSLALKLKNKNKNKNES